MSQVNKKPSLSAEVACEAMTFLENNPSADPLVVMANVESQQGVKGSTTNNTQQTHDRSSRNSDITLASLSTVMLTYEEPSTSTKTPDQLRLQNIQDIADVFPDYDRNKIYLLLEKHWDESDRINTVVKIIYEELTANARPAVSIPKTPGKPSRTSTFHRSPPPRSATAIVRLLSRDADNLAELFPSIPKSEIYEYLTAHYSKKNRSDVVFNELRTLVYTEDKVKELNNENLNNLRDILKDVKQLEDIFPDADPNDLLKEVVLNINQKDHVTNIAQMMTSKKKYPKKTDAIQRSRAISERTKLQCVQLSVGDFLKLVPDATSRYYDSSREPSESYKEHSLAYLRHAFPGALKDRIMREMKSNNYHFTPTLRDMEALISQGALLVTGPTPHVDLILPHLPETPDEEFYVELCFTRLEDQIRDNINRRNEKIEKLVKNKADALLMCARCGDDRVLPGEMLACSADVENHKACTRCVHKHAAKQVACGRGEAACLYPGCPGHYSLHTLHTVLPPQSFVALLNYRVCDNPDQEERHVDLVHCPFCSFATLIPEATKKKKRKNLLCLNPRCLEEFCLLCKGLAHAPLTCGQSLVTESRAMTRERLYIEESVTGALIRECWQCDTPFIKDGGCNFITCECGAFNCYVCKRRIDNHGHFGDQRNGRCPLYSDTELLHMENIVTAEKEAREVYHSSKAFRKGEHFKHADPTRVKDEKEKKPLKETPWPGYGSKSTFCTIL